MRASASRSVSTTSSNGGERARNIGAIDKDPPLDSITFSQSTHALSVPFATACKNGCIQAGASGMSCLSCARSFSESKLRNGASRSIVTCGCPRCFSPWMTRPLIRPAAAIARGVVRFRMISRFPTFTRREGPSVRRTALAGTCSERCNRLAA